MLITNTSPGQKEISQITLATNFNYTYTINASNIIFNNWKVIYFGLGDIFSSYYALSCTNNYNETLLTCENCPASCLTCNYSQYCT